MLTEAFLVGRRGEARRLRAQTAADLVYVVGYLQKRFDASQQWAAHLGSGDREDGWS